MTGVTLKVTYERKCVNDPLEKILFDTLAVHWMSAIDGVCTCGEVMYDTREDRKAVQGVVRHRAKVIADAIETKWYPNQWKEHEQLIQAMNRVMMINPADHATKSRDYGRGFSDALSLVHQAIQETP